MDNWRPPIHLFLSVCAITLLAATLFDRQLVQCNIESATYPNGMIFFTHTAIEGVPDSSLDSFSMPKQFFTESYEFFTSVSSMLILHAKLSFVFEIMAGYLILFTVIGALAANTVSVYAMKVMATLAMLSSIAAPILNMMLISDAGGVAITDIPDITAQLQITSIGSCSITRGGFYAWAAAFVWTSVFFSGWRSLRKSTAVTV